MLIEVDVKKKMAQDFFQRFFSFQNLKTSLIKHQPTDKLSGKVEWHCFPLKLHCLPSQPCFFYHLPLFQHVGSRGEGKNKQTKKKMRQRIEEFPTSGLNYHTQPFTNLPRYYGRSLRQGINSFKFNLNADNEFIPSLLIPPLSSRLLPPPTYWPFSAWTSCKHFKLNTSKLKPFLIIWLFYF